MAHLGLTVDPTAQAPWWKDIAEGALAVINSQRVATENKRRIEAGLPPLTQAEARAISGATQVDVALPPEVKTLIWVAGGAIILLTLSNLNKRRR